MAEHERHKTTEPSRGPRCPFCGASETELLSLFGSQLLTEQYYCRVCHTPFEHIKDDAEPDADHDPDPRQSGSR